MMFAWSAAFFRHHQQTNREIENISLSCFLPPSNHFSMIKTLFIIIINFILCRSDGNRVVVMVGVEIIHLNKNSKKKEKICLSAHHHHHSWIMLLNRERKQARKRNEMNFSLFFLVLCVQTKYIKVNILHILQFAHTHTPFVWPNSSYFYYLIWMSFLSVW